MSLGSPASAGGFGTTSTPWEARRAKLLLLAQQTRWPGLPGDPETPVSVKPGV